MSFALFATLVGGGGGGGGGEQGGLNFPSPVPYQLQSFVVI